MESFKEFMKPEIIWFLIGIAMFVLEILAPGLILGFFGIGAIVVSGLCFFIDMSLNVQLLIFIASSILLLLSLRKWAKRVFKGRVRDSKDMDYDIEEYVGKKAVVKKAISPDRPGKVEYHGTLWAAESRETLAEDTMVEIIGKDNLTFKVKSL